MKTRRELLSDVRDEVRYAYRLTRESDVEDSLLDAMRTIEKLLKMEPAEVAEAA